MLMFYTPKFIFLQPYVGRESFKCWITPYSPSIRDVYLLILRYSMYQSQCRTHVYFMTYQSGLSFKLISTLYPYKVIFDHKLGPEFPTQASESPRPMRCS